MTKAHVIGLGRSGIAAARLLKKQGGEVTISDRNNSPELQLESQALLTEGITVKLGYNLDFTEENLPTLIVVSPGVPWDAPLLLKARELGIETIGEMELAWRYLSNKKWIGITGTNGKTTTTALISAIFETAGFYAPACGNIGYAACELALAEPQKNDDWIIAEISSYQVESSPTLAPKIGIWTTFTPDHLARHKTLETYYNIKASLLKRSELQIFNGDDHYLSNMGLSQWPEAFWTSVKGADYVIGEKGIYIDNGWVIFQGEKIVQTQSLKMVGEHNQQNLLMSVLTAKLAGIENQAIVEAITNFPGVPHRLEYICTWSGIDFINDSKATNYDAAEVGLNCVDSPVILIAGGEAKPGDDTVWLEKIKEKAAAVLLIGKAADDFAKRLTEVGYNNYEIVETMAKAVKRSAELGLELKAKVVLLSPACASFDQYQNFEQRGDDFKQLCLNNL